MTRPLQIQVTDHEWDLIAKILQTISHRFTIYAFGSRVNGVPKPYSDLDLALETEAGISLYEMAVLEQLFAESALPFKVDLIQVKDLSESFRKLIERAWVKLDLN